MKFLDKLVIRYAEKHERSLYENYEMVLVKFGTFSDLLDENALKREYDSWRLSSLRGEIKLAGVKDDYTDAELVAYTKHLFSKYDSLSAKELDTHNKSLARYTVDRLDKFLQENGFRENRVRIKT